MEFAELTYMPNAALDQFSHALMWKIVPVILICGISGILLRELLQWLERKANSAGRSRRASRDARKSVTTANLRE